MGIVKKRILKNKRLVFKKVKEDTMVWFLLGFVIGVPAGLVGMWGYKKLINKE